MSKAAELANLIGNINAGGGGVNRNVIINGAMNVAQRGTSSTGLGASAGYFTVDRFKLDFTTSGRLTMTQDSSAPSGFANSMKLACTTADTSVASGEYLVISHRIEGQNLQGFAKGTSDAKPFAVSFYVKGNASATYVVELFDNDNSRHVNKSFTVSTDWTRVELSFPADTTGAFGDDNAQSLNMQIWLHAGSDWSSGSLQTTWGGTSNTTRAVGASSFFDSTDRTFFITGLQLEVGQNPTEFEHKPFAQDLFESQRYYFKWLSNTTYDVLGTGHYGSDTAFFLSYELPITMRAEPTIAESGDWRVYTSGGVAVTSGPSLNRATPNNVSLEFTTGDNSDIGQGAFVSNNNDADAFIEFKAEL